MARIADVVSTAVARTGSTRERLLDVAREVHEAVGYMPPEAVSETAARLRIQPAEVRDALSFYHFFSLVPQGGTVVRLCDAVVERHHRMPEVAAALEKELGIRFGQTTADGAVTLQYTSCLGLSDRPCSALVNGAPVTGITPAGVPELVARIGRAEFRRGAARHLGPGVVPDTIGLRGPVILAEYEAGCGLRAALASTPEQVIAEITAARLRGRGGAGFPAGMKWEFCRKAAGDAHFVICNADEGEPGTFKDRLILGQAPELLLDGLTIAAYAVGAREGFIYLRGEYEYLLDHLEAALARRRRDGLLGTAVGGRAGFDFDIRVQLGAGAYVCGEESALIESLEGKRGAPRDRPPFPVTNGFRNQPTSVNNVETLCCAARIMERGSQWFADLGTRDSTGTKLISVSGDIRRPGVYEFEFGVTLNRVLAQAGATDAAAVQIGGPSGSLVSPRDFGRGISFEDLPTGGSCIVFSAERDLLRVAREFTAFFARESCGWCAPCRIGTRLLVQGMDRLCQGEAGARQLQELRELAGTVRGMSRCGLGQTAANPLLSSLTAFEELYDAAVAGRAHVPRADLVAALSQYHDGRIADLEGRATVG